MRSLAFAIFILTTLAPVAASTQQSWLDADGQPLPFETDEELLVFLRTAKVVSEKPIGVGVNQSVKVTLQQDGVRAHAIFARSIREKTPPASKAVPIGCSPTATCSSAPPTSSLCCSRCHASHPPCCVRSEDVAEAYRSG